MATHHKFKSDITESELLLALVKLNENRNINGIIVQLPFDSVNNINSELITNSVDPAKDVDGLHYANAGKLLNAATSDAFVPCTPKGCMELIKSTGIDLCGKSAVVVGRSKLVGAPMANLLRHANATVTICHSKTENIGEVCRGADILVVAIGKTKYITNEMVKQGAIVIDCGINSVLDQGICPVKHFLPRFC